MSSIDIKFGSFDFADTPESWEVEISQRVIPSTIPRKDGAKIPQANIGTKVITFEGSVNASTHDNLRAARQTMLDAILGTKDYLTLYDDRRIYCQVDSYSDDFVMGSSLKVLHFEVSFIGDNPWYESISTVTESGFFVGSGTTGTTAAINILGVIDPPAKITVNNTSGSSIVDDLIVENSTTGEAFKYRGTLTNGKDLVVDNNVDGNGIIITNDGVNAISDFEGDIFVLKAAINNIFAYFGLLDVDIEVKYRPRYY